MPAHGDGLGRTVGDPGGEITAGEDMPLDDCCLRSTDDTVLLVTCAATRAPGSVAAAVPVSADGCLLNTGFEFCRINCCFPRLLVRPGEPW